MVNRHSTSIAYLEPWSDLKASLYSFSAFRYSPEIVAQVLAFQRKLHRRFQEAQLIARVMALALKGEAVDLFMLQ